MVIHEGSDVQVAEVCDPKHEPASAASDKLNSKKVPPNRRDKQRKLTARKSGLYFSNASRIYAMASISVGGPPVAKKFAFHSHNNVSSPETLFCASFLAEIPFLKKYRRQHTETSISISFYKMMFQILEDDIITCPWH